jgi:formylglycine-generating enzyme
LESGGFACYSGIMMKTFSNRQSQIFVCVLIVASGMFVNRLSAAPPDVNARGIVAVPPAGVRSVKAEGAYMIPYTEKIPGTDVTFEMIPVPGGDFLMGSPPKEARRNADEGPQVRIKVPPFWMGKCEVTWAEYHAFMAMYDAFKKLQRLASNPGTTKGESAADWRLVQMHAWNGKLEEKWNVDAVTSPTPLYDSTFTYGAGDQPNQPAVTITPFAARQYTKWISGITGNNYRLPTESEWEYACRAGTTTAYSFGDDAKKLGDYAWYKANGNDQTHPVGTKKPNPWGFYDMHGNVAEWTLDQYQPKAYTKLAPGPTDASAAVRWPTKTFPRVIRGGNWLAGPAAARSAARQKSEEKEWKLSDPNIPLSPWWYTEEPATGVGMRIMRPLKPLSAEEKTRVWEADVEDIRQDVKDRLREGRGALGVADEKLPAAVEAAEKLNKSSQ